MKAMRPLKKPKRTAEAPAKEPATVTGVRQEALASFAGSLAHVTAIASGICYVSIRERCTGCGQEPKGNALTLEKVMKLVPRPAEITQANALLATISLPAQTENLGLAEGQALIEATIGRFHAHAIAYGVPREIADKWYHEARQPLQVA